jgi:hypothetical protein
LHKTNYDNRNRLTGHQPGGALTLRGTLNEAATVTSGGRPTTVAADNSFEGSVQVGAGTNDIVIAATDGASNVRTNTYRLTVSGGDVRPESQRV